MMKIFIAGITGATGRLVASQLLTGGHSVFGFARNPDALPDEIRHHPALTVKQGSLLALSDAELTAMLDQVDGVVSCLGHNMTCQGIWGHPRTLVRDAVQRLTTLTQHKPMRFVLMSSNGVANRLIHERYSLTDRAIIAVLRKILPPHRDNELAADFLQHQTFSQLEWCIVRPDNLVDESDVTDYAAFPSPQLGVIAGAGQTSRINVAAFMCELLTQDKTWARWEGAWPVLYNEGRLNEKLALM
ncbi:MAG: SDR family oxidoreductase [Gammaproteobacteria bacterium]|nr:SDR family oxidoreductase [Gammaproteobacteria bacterium]